MKTETKKTYVKPELVVRGSIEQQTLAGWVKKFNTDGSGIS